MEYGLRNRGDVNPELFGDARSIFARDQQAELRYRLAIRYAIEGDLRFISHHDTLRLFERALARARVSVRYSEGFNPRPRMSLNLPRPVGVASRDETLILEMSGRVETHEVMQRLAEQMPAGLTLSQVEELAESDRRRPCEVEYVLPIGPAERAAVSEKCVAFLRAPRIVIERAMKDSTVPKQVDVRSYITHLEIEEDHLRWTQTISQAGTARLGEVLDAIGLDSRGQLHRVVRRRVVCG